MDLTKRETAGNLRVEGTAEVNSTSDRLQGRQVNGVQLVVTADDETTVDLGQHRHADVGQLGVVVEGQVSGGGQVGGGESAKVGAPEAELTLELLQGRHGDAANVAEGHVAGSAQVGEVNLKLVVVAGEADQASGVHEAVDVDRLKVGVVEDLEQTDGLQHDTIEVGETSVDDGDIAGISDTGGEDQGLELGKSLPEDGADRGECGEVELGEGGEPVQLERVADRVERGGNDASDVRTTLAGQAAGDLLDAVQGEVAREGIVDGHITAEGRAAGNGVGIALGRDGHRTAG